jgi:hypothetical protein
MRIIARLTVIAIATLLLLLIALLTTYAVRAVAAQAATEVTLSQQAQIVASDAVAVGNRCMLIRANLAANSSRRNGHLDVPTLAIVAPIAHSIANADTDAGYYDYISSVRDADDVVYVTSILIESAELYDLDPWLLIALAQYESTFYPGAIGDAGERGLLQIHPVHADSFPDYGLDWDIERDRVVYGACRIREGLDSGLPMYRAGDKACAMRPWSARHRAWRLYQRLSRDDEPEPEPGTVELPRPAVKINKKPEVKNESCTTNS